MSPKRARIILTMNTDPALVRLLQLVSPSLPIGMYSYSQGLETALEDGLISNAQDTSEWLNGLLKRCLMHVDIPIGQRLYQAWSTPDESALQYWSKQLLAHRETQELRKEDQQTGQALAKLLYALEMHEAEYYIRSEEATLMTLFMLAAHHWHISLQDALTGYTWGWLENQVLSAIKLVPLGQVAGQKLLFELSESIPSAVLNAMQLSNDDIGGSVFALPLCSSRHEVQYSRLFRS